MRPTTQVALLATLSSAAPLAERADEVWHVTRFAAYVAAHSITQIITFSVELPGSEGPVECSTGGSAALSSTPFLLPVNGTCVEGSGLSFNFTQVEDFAIKLQVNNEEGVQATHTSDPNSVKFVSTGSTPLDTMTAYVGPQDYDLTGAGEYN
ncbi:hypothetical protein TruAng_004500 [Truncatella angustata]|nr:hypothetical protein TruAng_004500 [Truncatella angustata]